VAVSVAVAFEHILALLTVGVGIALTVTTPLTLAVHPLAAVAVTVYVPDAEVVIEVVVAPVLHAYDVPPVAVSVSDSTCTYRWAIDSRSRQRIHCHRAGCRRSTSCTGGHRHSVSTCCGGCDRCGSCTRAPCISPSSCSGQGSGSTGTDRRTIDCGSREYIYRHSTRGRCCTSVCIGRSHSVGTRSSSRYRGSGR
jgi:hypothetical protein